MLWAADLTHTYIPIYMNLHQDLSDPVKMMPSILLILELVLGPSWLGTLKHYDMIRGTAIDYMHCSCCVVQRLINLWLKPCNSNKSYYVGHLSRFIHGRLLNL